MKDSMVKPERLYKCCIGTILNDPGPDEEGRLLRCVAAHDARTMVFSEGAWQWYLVLS